jgi:hypothetical protein
MAEIDRWLKGCRQVAAYSEVPGGDPNSVSNCPRRPRRIGAKNGVPPANTRLLGAGTEFWHPTPANPVGADGSCAVQRFLVARA